MATNLQIETNISIEMNISIEKNIPYNLVYGYFLKNYPLIKIAQNVIYKTTGQEQAYLHEVKFLNHHDSPCKSFYEKHIKRRHSWQTVLLHQSFLLY